MLSRSRREPTREHTEMVSQIKTIARQQMAQHGTAGLSLRGIARELGITAPAIYNYFPRLDDLITALIVDTFTDFAEAMEAAAAAAPDRPYDQVLALCLQAREWAMVHPVDFQLIYGNPIPGYYAPEDLTIPLARRPFLGMFRSFIQAHQSGELVIPVEYEAVPPTVRDGSAAWQAASGIELPHALLALLMSGWSRIYGLIALEMYHHVQPLIGDAAALYRYEIQAFLQHLGMTGEGAAHE